METKIRRKAMFAVITLGAMYVLSGCIAGPAASLVLGQPDFRSIAPNQGRDTAAANTMNYPAGPAVVYQNSVYVADGFNNRILVFSPVPTVSNAAAKGIIASSDPSLWANLNGPWAIAVAGGKMFVGDSGNGRVLIWNKIPVVSEKPDNLLGQDTLTSSPVKDCAHMSSPRGLFASAEKLIVSDFQNHRIFIWNSIPLTNKAAPDLVLGSSDCSPDEGGKTRHMFNGPRGVWTDGIRLVVADTDNYRVLIWNRFPSKTTDDADIVLGTGVESPGRNQFSPYGVASDGTRLFVSDWVNNRVLVWNRFPTKTGDLPDEVIGQKNFEYAGANGALAKDAVGIPSERTLWDPEGVSVYGNQLWVTDSGNNRVLMYKLK